jgi:hypothetical protein
MNLFQRLSNHISGFFNTTLEPWLENLGKQVKHDLADKLSGYAHIVVQELLDGGAQLLAGGDPHLILANTLAAAEATGKKAIADGVQITGHDLLVAVAGAVATAQAAVPATIP